MRLVWSASLCAGLALLTVACSDDNDAANQPSHSSFPGVPGFQLDLAVGRPQEVILGPMPGPSERIEGGNPLPTTSTPEGEIPSDEFYDQLGPQFPLVTSTFRPGGSWLPTGIHNAAGEIVAVRLASEAPDGLGFSVLTFDAVAGDAVQAARVLGPPDAFDDTVSGAGIRYYPPLPVLVRGQVGVYLHQELPEVDPRASGIPLCTLTWLEGEVYYRLSGICSSHDSGRYDMFSLIGGANSIDPYTPE